MLPVGSQQAWVQFETQQQFGICLVDVSTGTIRNSMSLPEQLLILEGGDSEWLIFTRFQRRDWPISTGLLAWEKRTQTWQKFDKARFQTMLPNGYCRVAWQGEGELVLRLQDGKTFENIEAATQEDHHWTYHPQDSYYSMLSKLISTKTGWQAEGAIEYSECDQYLLLAFHCTEGTTLRPHYLLLSRKGEVCWKDAGKQQVHAPINTLLLANEQVLVLLTNDDELISIPWKKM
ncbi:MAG: hypothetical protein MUF42_01195 [Cytophagaceae bacterium]|nr:hypothetical protein [Cytophagaceae bacterium]